MTESVTDIIVARSQRHDRVGMTFVSSALAHAMALALVVLIPHRPSKEQPREVMTISLGGAVGPRTGGLTEIGGRPVQEVAPPQPPKRVEPPPAAEPPKMAIAPKARPRAETAKATPEQTPSRTPSTGAEITKGSTPVDTGARGTGFGLSSAGGAGGPVTLDVSDFCCPDYLERMIVNIRRNWQQDQGRPGASVIRFTIRRDGSIEGIAIDRTSGYGPLDLAAQRAVQLTTDLPQLPPAFPNPTLTVHMTFRY